ncbi:MAG TPA: hypothetical protein V6C76_07095 [Drouetiella sp.]
MNNKDQINFRRLAGAAALSGGFALLAAEIRFEHRAALVDEWRPWIPIVWSAVMPMLIMLEAWSNRLVRRRMLASLYILTIGIGLLGVYFHADGKFVERIGELIYVWTSSLETGSMLPARHAPILAPLSFVGLGLLGLFVLLERRVSTVVKPTKCFVTEDATLVGNEAA